MGVTVAPGRALVLLALAEVALAQLTFGGGGSVVRTETRYSPTRSRAGPGGGDNPFGAVVPGVGLLAGSAALLWWNEGRTARTERMLIDARRALTPVDATSRAALNDVDGESLVHMSGRLSSGGVRDGLFPEVRRPEALRLRRLTENYQWMETKHVRERRISQDHVQRETRYDYHTGWSNRQISSGGFQDGSRHHNPAARIPAGIVETVATDARLPNGLHVPGALLDQMDEWEGTV